jgi:deoxyribose-phosphate aldolase
MEYNKYIDHTLLKANATKEEILNIFKQAKEFKFKAVCINPT